MTKWQDLFNVWTIGGGILIGIGAFFHGIYSSILTCTGFLLWAIALYFELEKLGYNKIKFISLPIVMICITIPIYQFYKGNESPINKTLLSKNSVITKNDSIKNVIPKIQKSNIVAQKKNVPSNRAWINIDQSNFIDVDSGKTPQFHFTVLNSSDLPASVQPYQYFFKIDTDLYYAELKYPPKKDRYNVYTLAPRQKSGIQRATFLRSLTNTELSDIIKEKRFLFISIMIIYKSGSENAFDTTRFSVRYNLSKKITEIHGDERFNFMH